jgi:cell division protein ZapA
VKQSVQVSILGQQFNLRSDAPPEHVHRVARYVEEQIQLVTASGRAVDTLQAAILALLNVSAAHLEGKTLSEVPEQADSEEVGRLVEKIEKALAD